MAKHGVLLERDNFITQMVNRAGVSAKDIDGGSPVAEGAIQSANDELYTLTAPSATTARVGIAFNPSKKYDVIGDQRFPAKSLDDRNYYNVKGDVVDYFFPTVGIEFGVQMANIDGTTKPTVGKFLEPKADTFTYEIKDAQTDGVPSFEVVQILSAKYPTGDFTEDKEPVYVVKTRYNG